MRKDKDIFNTTGESMNNNQIDEKLKQLAQQSNPELPDGYEERIDRLLSELNREKHRWRVRPIMRVAAAAVAICICFGSSGIEGAMNYLNSRLLDMSDTEINSYNSMVQDIPLDVDSYTRKLTEAETAQMEELQKAYKEEGRYPTGELLIVKTEQEIRKDLPAYVEETSTYYLPERRLTDEELLEILDFHYKRDYSVSESNKDDRVTNTEVVISKDMEELAVKAVRSALGLDVSKNTYMAEIVPNGKEYWVKFKNGTKDACLVVINAETGYVKEVSNSDAELDNRMVEFDEIAIDKGYELVQKCLGENIWEQKKIVSVRAEYYLEDDKDTLYHGNIRYLLEADDGNCWMCCYNVNEQSLRNVSYIASDDNVEKGYSLTDSAVERFGLTRELKDLK